MGEPWAPARLVPLAIVTRNGRTEAQHLGAVAVVDARGALQAAAGDPELVSYLRSAAKPFQAAVVVESGAAEAFALGPRELAVIAGSHAGEAEHVALVQQILARLGLDEAALRCGAQPPLSPAAAAVLAAAGEQPRPIHHNCSGKHAGMLAVCRHAGWPLESYLVPSHPVQQRNREMIAALAALPVEAVGVGVDGCGVPTFAVSLRAMARLYAQLAAPQALPPARARALDRVREAMLTHPHLVAGSGRLDTALLRAAGGRLVVKGGAEGVHGAGLVGEGVGVALKIADGASRAVGPAFLAVLARLGWLSAEALAPLVAYAQPAVLNSRGERVGEIVGLAPW
jgi:L-asparaginase II